MTTEHPTYEHLDRLVDVDPIGLRDTAWAAIQELRAQLAEENEQRLTAQVHAEEVGELKAERDRLLIWFSAGEVEIDQLREDLEHLRARLNRVDDALRSAGIEYPLGAAGVSDLAAMANGRLEELQTAEADLERERRDHAATREGLAAIEAKRIRRDTDEGCCRAAVDSDGHAHDHVEWYRDLNEAEAELERQRPVIETARAAIVELGNKIPGGADWDERVAYRLGLLTAAVDRLDQATPSTSEPTPNPLAVPGCTCPWNNGLLRSPLGHHVSCPVLSPGHTPGDGCEHRLPYDMGHTDPRPCQPSLVLPTGTIYSTCSLPAGHDGVDHHNAAGQPWRFNERGDILMNTEAAP